MEQCCMARFPQSLTLKIITNSFCLLASAAQWQLLCFFFNLEQMTGCHQTSRVLGCFQTVGSRYDTEDRCGCAFFPFWFSRDTWHLDSFKEISHHFPAFLVKRPLSWMWKQQISVPWAENAPTFAEFLVLRRLRYFAVPCRLFLRGMARLCWGSQSCLN